jgi:pimeloyl-ACP methyl ester carboxylesterase
MLNLVFLPVSAPGDDEYGTIPNQIAGPDTTNRQVTYPILVWYNQAVRQEAIEQIRAWALDPVVLVGFSKSGLGAWNLARTIPDRVRATIIFDAPVAREQPEWDIGAFYAEDAAWQDDLPIRTIREFEAAMPAPHQLILISGEVFHEEMCAFSRELDRAGLAHAFLPRPHLKHQWNSGWIEEGLNSLIDSTRR